MAEGHGIEVAEERRLLVERIASSPHLNRSARLKDLLHYLTERVLEGEAGEIREHEVGHKVFGRPVDYDTTADNIVRVHASMLRKRLEQYFAAEGAGESLIIEIPKGNYAPVFRERTRADVEVSTPPPMLSPDKAEVAIPARQTNWPVWLLLATTLLFAATSLWLWRKEQPAAAQPAPHPTVALFWSQVFAPNRQTDLVVDDSAVALYQELTGKQITLSEYFDRSYLRSVTGENGLGAEAASSLILRRQSSYASSSFLWKLLQLPESHQWRGIPRFARDYSFRELKANNVVLLGNARTNPWIQAFEARLGVHWQYDKASGVYYPVDLRPPGFSANVGEGYWSVALLPNLGGTGNVVVVSATGGSAMNNAAEFLSDERSMQALRAKLPGKSGSAFSNFEALISVAGRGTASRKTPVVIAHPI